MWAWPIAGEERRIPRKGKPTGERKHTLRERKDDRESMERKKGKGKGGKKKDGEAQDRETEKEQMELKVEKANNAEKAQGRRA